MPGDVTDFFFFLSLKATCQKLLLFWERGCRSFPQHAGGHQVYATAHWQMHSMGRVTVFYCPATWEPPCHIWRIYRHFWRVDAIMQGAYN